MEVERHIAKGASSLFPQVKSFGDPQFQTVANGGLLSDIYLLGLSAPPPRPPIESWEPLNTKCIQLTK
jgi:hypothetical protein